MADKNVMIGGSGTLVRSTAAAWLLATLAASLPCDAQEAAERDSEATLPSLRQIIRHFNFDESDAGPNSLPVPFYRYLAPADGFPPFGSTRMTQTASFNGSGSLEFELAGGSMSVRLPTLVIPILPLTDYVVSVRVRCEGLQHARPRLAAWMHDQVGAAIESSRTYSRAGSIDGTWDELRIEVRGDSSSAADLVVELQVIQPEHLDSANQDFQPRLEDVSGKVWFDELVISHLPKIDLRLQQKLNLLEVSQLTNFEILVRELTEHQLMSRLQIADLNGKCWYDTSTPAPRGAEPGIFRIPAERCGWYRAQLAISSPTTVREQSLDFAVLPVEKAVTRNPRFGIVLSQSDLQSSNTAEFLHRTGSGWAVVPIWSNSATPFASATTTQSIQSTIDDLLNRDFDLVFNLQQLPIEVATRAQRGRHDVLGALAEHAEVCRSAMGDFLVNYGLEVNRWMVGDFEGADAFWNPQLDRLSQQAGASLAQYIPKPVMYLAWSADQEPPADKRVSAYAINVPHQIAPSSLETYLAGFDRTAQTMIRLELLPSDVFTPQQRFADSLIRGLHAWRANVPLITIDAPWRSEERSGRLSPAPEFLAWRTLCTKLMNREFAGELATAPGVECWMVRSLAGEGSLLIAWSNRPDPSSDQQLHAQLAAGPVTVTDAFGNKATIEPVNGYHTIQLSQIPVFVHGVNLPLLQFKGEVRIEPDFVTAVAKVHEHEILLHNPFDMTVSGIVRFSDSDQWRVSPLVQDFTIPAGKQVRLPFQIIPQRSILAGSRKLAALVQLTADRTYNLAIDLELSVGLPDLDFKASWSVARNSRTGEHDLIITQIVTNNGSSTKRLEAYLLAEGVGQNRRMISSLAPGQTAVRQFQIPNGAETLAGKQVRVGVMEHDGVARLNYLLNISPATIATARSEAFDR